jgi:hypothetical protein
MPESVTDRPTKSHEYIFLLSKNAQYFYDAEAVKEPANPNVGWYKSNSGFRDEIGIQGGLPVKAGTKSGGAVGNGISRNRRSVWTVATAPFSGSHFATYPPALIEPCILAGTSARGECPKCGKAWVRVVEKSGGTIGKSWHDHSDDIVSGMTQVKHSGGVGNAKDGNGKPYTVETLGWRAQCACTDATGEPLAPVPQIVLDPFGGSGTTMQVSRKHNRYSVGLDLSLDYLQKQARSRLQLTALDEFTNGKATDDDNFSDLPLFQDATQ